MIFPYPLYDIHIILDSLDSERLHGLLAPLGFSEQKLLGIFPCLQSQNKDLGSLIFHETPSELLTPTKRALLEARYGILAPETHLEYGSCRLYPEEIATVGAVVRCLFDAKESYVIGITQESIFDDSVDVGMVIMGGNPSTGEYFEATNKLPLLCSALRSAIGSNERNFLEAPGTYALVSQERIEQAHDSSVQRLYLQ